MGTISTSHNTGTSAARQHAIGMGAVHRAGTAANSEAPWRPSTWETARSARSLREREDKFPGAEYGEPLFPDAANNKSAHRVVVARDCKLR